MYFPLTFDGYALYSYAQYGYVPPALHSDGLLHTWLAGQQLSKRGRERERGRGQEREEELCPASL